MTDNREWTMDDEFAHWVPVSRLREAEEKRDKAHEALRECIRQWNRTSARVRELEEALRHIDTRLTAADGELVAQGVAAAGTARVLAREALKAKETG